MRENILKLAQKIAGQKIDFKESDPQYCCLDIVLSDEDADVALAMDRRVPIGSKKLAPKCGKSVEETHRILLELEDIGMVESSFERGCEEFVLLLFVPGSMELMVVNTELVNKYPKLANVFEEFTRTTLEKVAAIAPMSIGGMKVIPIEKSIEGEARVAKEEEISYWVNKYDYYAVGPCACRRTRRMMGEGTGQPEDDLCLFFGETAKSMVRTHKAHQIKKQEVWDTLQKGEELGYMHQITNIDGKDKIFSICNCHASVCFGLRNSLYFNTPNLSRSNFVAQVDKEKCVACGQCVENCPSNAVRLGEKLCTETPIKINKQILPDDHEWGPQYYNPDYRDNRQYVVPETGTAPCKTECPAHIAVQGYIKLASLGKYKEALELIKKENPLPAICGRICPHKCEDACTRGNIDNPIAIDEIKKFIADQDLNSKNSFIPKKKHDYKQKIAIVGSGPAGISCAYYLAVEGYKVTVFEKQPQLGGMLTLGIPSFRLQKDIINAEINVVKELGVEFKTCVEVGKDITIQQLRKQGYCGFYLAIGAQGARNLGIEGEDAKGVITGVDFLRNVGLDKPDKLSGNVVVIGGGNVAIDVARTATRTGAKTVNMYCLESDAEMPALQEEIDEATAENIVINNGWGPNRIVVKDRKVTGVEFKRCLSVFDENQRFSPKYDENDIITVPADFVILSIGQSIVWDNLLDGLNVELNRNNTAKADSLSYVTGEKDIFVGGDAYSGPQFAINAIASGKEAAISLNRNAWEGHSLTIGRDRREFKSIDKDNLVIGGYDDTKRQRPLHIKENKGTFKDTRATFTEKQLKKETERCLGCGTAVVDENICFGCGLCTVKCKFDAISLVKKYNEESVAYEDIQKKLVPYMMERKTKIAIRKIKDESELEE